MKNNQYVMESIQVVFVFHGSNCTTICFRPIHGLEVAHVFLKFMAVEIYKFWDPPLTNGFS